MIEPFSAVRALHFAATLLLAGTLLFQIGVAGPALREGAQSLAALHRQWRWLSWISLVLVLASGALWALMLAASVSDQNVSAVLSSGTFTRLISETQFGHVWLARLALLATLAAALLRPPSRGRDWLLLIAAACLLGALAFSGHSGSGPGLPGMFYAGADVVHLLAAGAWVGGLLPLALLLNRALHGDQAEREQAKIVTRRFSVLGIICVGALLATGIVNTWNLVGSVDALVDTGYGQLLLQKIALFVLMVGLAAVNRYRFTPRMSERGATLSLWRNTVIETGLGALALVAVGILGTIPPGSHGGHAHETPQVPEGAAFVHIHAEPAMADVTAAPGPERSFDLSIRLMRDDFTLMPARSVTVRLSQPEAADPPLSLVATEISVGYWRAGPVQLQRSGVWTVQLDIGQEGNRTISLDAPIVLEP